MRRNSDSVRNLGPNSHSATAAMTHIIKPTNQNTTGNDAEHTDQCYIFEWSLGENNAHTHTNQNNEDKTEKKFVRLWQRRKHYGAVAAADDSHLLFSYLHRSTKIHCAFIEQCGMHQIDIIQSDVWRAIHDRCKSKGTLKRSRGNLLWGVTHFNGTLLAFKTGLSIWNALVWGICSLVRTSFQRDLW